MKLYPHHMTYAGNPKSLEHEVMCLNEKVSSHDVCEIDVRVHLSFTPSHPAVLAFMKAHQALLDAIEGQNDPRVAELNAIVARDGECPNFQAGVESCDCAYCRFARRMRSESET